MMGVFEQKVIIIGGGPAGAAAAIQLRKLNIPCTVLEKWEKARPRCFETFPPNAKHLLRELDMQELVDRGGHGHCGGNAIIWGSEKIQWRDYYAEPNGLGWHLNRNLFNLQLRDSAKIKGVQWLGGWRLEGLKRMDGCWGLECLDAKGNRQSMKALFVVDATGRAARLARMLGVRRHRQDGLTAYSALLPKSGNLGGTASWVEAVEDGWWYLARRNDQRIMIQFMSDVDLHEVPEGKTKEWLLQQFRKTRELDKMFSPAGPEELDEIQIKPASTAALEEITGQGWLAVGDAACSYDPLTSYGLTSALGSGIYAGLAIAGHLAGQPEALDAYCQVQQKTFNQCMAMLQHQYQLETRWPDSVFWQRRRLDEGSC